MVNSIVQNYLNLVSGLSRATRNRALATARGMLAQVGLEDAANDAGERVTKLAEELQAAGRANRQLVENLVSAEVGKSAARWGFVRRDELDALRHELAELRRLMVDEPAAEAAAPSVVPDDTAAHDPVVDDAGRGDAVMGDAVVNDAGDAVSGDAAEEPADSPAQRAAVQQEAVQQAALRHAEVAHPDDAPVGEPQPRRSAPVDGEPADGEPADGELADGDRADGDQVEVDGAAEDAIAATDPAGDVAAGGDSVR